MNGAPDHTDLLVVGGGIAGAGVALQAARRGARVTLIERHDWASGASSRSSKLVHGGLRYLAQGQWRLTRASVQQREQLLRELPALVRRLGFMLPHGPGLNPGRPTLQAALAVYDALAQRRSRAWVSAADASWLVPGLHAPGGASVYDDATTDDARLTLRVLAGARRHGARLHAYTELQALQRRGDGWNATLRTPEGHRRTLEARCVVAALGAQLGPWAARFGLAAPLLRPLRGSHLLLPGWRLPLARAVAWQHPADGRPVFAYPWLGCTMVGTTDLDHPDPDTPPRISAPELHYLLHALRAVFPRAGITAADVRSTWAGIRPVVAGDGAPSAQSREHLVQAGDRLVVLAGGKLTTFAEMAQQALDLVQPWLPALQPAAAGLGLADENADADAFSWENRCAAFVDADAWTRMLHTDPVQHLDDLMLRRTRWGLCLPAHGQRLLPRLQRACQQALGWDAARWAQECVRYQRLVRTDHGLPADADTDARTQESTR